MAFPGSEGPPWLTEPVPGHCALSSWSPEAGWAFLLSTWLPRSPTVLVTLSGWMCLPGSQQQCGVKVVPPACRSLTALWAPASTPRPQLRPSPAQGLASRQLLVAVGWMAGFGQETPSQLFSYAQKPRRPGRCEETPKECEECVWPPSPVSTQLYRSRCLRERRGLLCGPAAVRLLPVSSPWSFPNTPRPKHPRGLHP